MPETYYTSCIEPGCKFTVTVGDNTSGTKFYKGSGKLYVDTEFAAHGLLCPGHLAIFYNDDDLKEDVF